MSERTEYSDLFDCPSSDIDPFSDEYLANPWPFLAVLRDIGPVFHVPKYGIWGVARHEEVTEVLRNHEDYSSASGVGYTDLRTDNPWRPPSIILEADPPLHTKTRKIISKVLTPGALSNLKDMFDDKAISLVNELSSGESFDAISDLAEAYPLSVFPDSVGLQQGSRQNLLRYGSMVFNGHGPRNHLFEQSMADGAEAKEWVNNQCSRKMLKSNGFGAKIYESVDSGELTEDEAGLLVRSFLSAGVDTTVNAIGFAILNFANNQDQWEILRNEPSLARSAFEEVVRLEAPVTNFFRTTTHETQIAGFTIPANSKVLVAFAGGCRDPRKWDEPDKFDIRRRTAGHTGFGAGIHGCVGAIVARLEGESLLSALSKKVRCIELVGAPKVRLNNTLRGLSYLPVRFHTS